MKHVDFRAGKLKLLQIAPVTAFLGVQPGASGAIGLVILIDHSSSRNVEEMEYFLTLFHELISETGAVVGVTHVDEAPEKPFDIYYEVLEQRGMFLPVLPVDVREPDHVILLLETLMTTLEYRSVLTYA